MTQSATKSTRNSPNSAMRLAARRPITRGSPSLPGAGTPPYDTGTGRATTRIHHRRDGRRDAAGRLPQRSPRIIRIPGIDEVIGIVLIDRAPSFASV